MQAKSVQPRILAMKTGSHGRKHRTFQEEEGFDFRESAARRLVSAELRRFSPDCVMFILLMCVVGPVFLSRVSRGSQHVQTIGQSCVQCDSRTFEKEEIGFFLVHHGRFGR